MTIITVNELEKNLNHYIGLSAYEDVIVKEGGKIVAVLTSPELRKSSSDAFLALAGKYDYVDYRAILDSRDA